jgi:DNA polymerase I-like protein with 3'-5' exonuclease and polymerase domains
MLPMPLRYAGAITHRLAGEWHLNVQNLVRDTTKSKLRRALVAPPGHKIVVGDLSQIECRLTARLAGQANLLEQFRRNVDVYANFGTRLFGTRVSKTETPGMRFIGKTAVLSLGYSAGVERFYRTVITQARQLGIPLDGIFNKRVAQRTVATYRRIFARIPALWRKLDWCLRAVLLNDRRQEIQFGPMTIMSKRIKLPNGLFLRYDSVRDEELYGAKLLENCCQALARVILMQAALRLAQRGYRYVLQAHDEPVFVIPDDRLEEAKKIISQELTRAPVWMPDLPLQAEIRVGPNYGDVC